ncbi:SDR family NAD(P)-dependent oxidoreductase [Acuticoccus sp. I52.16.1]|uniref:SDR family NAD(P)-dependent oxidoreductase n=1 Tax=Acuticoccus sp. I52.16.1 TaxID=2928472 RepID=UPI001FD385EA|nr:SDR family NAD(P)-dependent oxidoreductase [Acuticoccus sp. I52.16.1]UOM33949.1 SDR family oxidoreductase [Acuticoccus sp. I52.16.1]
MDLKMQGRVAVITGPAKGMGAAITRAFAAEGVDLALFGRDTDAIAPVAEEARAMGRRVEVVRCDVTDAAAVEREVGIVAATFGRIDILVNVAGGTGPIGKTGAETSPEEFDEIVSLNMGGSFHMIRAVAPVMQRQRYGKIVNVGGTFGMRGKAGRLAYSSSKWGLRGLTKSFALELGGDNINVNCVAPGMVDGPRFRTKVVPEMARRLGISEDEAAQRHADDYALKRVSTDEDIASATLFLASDLARQITGVDIPVDGGWAAL